MLVLGRSSSGSRRTGDLRWFGEKTKASLLGHLTRESKASFQQEKKLQEKGEAVQWGAVGQEGLLKRTKVRPLWCKWREGRWPDTELDPKRGLQRLTRLWSWLWFMIQKVEQLGQERWLGSYKHFFLFERTHVLFLAIPWWLTTVPKCQGVQHPLLTSTGTGHTWWGQDTETHKIKQFFKHLNSSHKFIKSARPDLGFRHTGVGLELCAKPPQ